jgi:diphthamide synthase (EF-2-diphthine--ammonia ligase)
VLGEARALGVSYLAFGDLFLEDVRAERHDRLAGSGIEPLFPIWGRPAGALAREMIDAGLESYLVCIDLERMPRPLAGRKFDHALLAELPAAVDPCGEHGEYHSCVTAGPMFSRRIDVTVGATVERDGLAYTDLALVPPRLAGRD